MFYLPSDIQAWVRLPAGIVLFLLLATVLELHRQVEQFRQYIGLTPDAVPVPFNEAADITKLGIPASVERDLGGRWAVLILSDTCATCADIARALPASLPENLTVVVQSEAPARAHSWMLENGLKVGPNVVHDSAGALVGELGVRLSPVAVRFEAGQADGAVSVPSVAQLDAVVDWLSERQPSLNLDQGGG